MLHIRPATPHDVPLILAFIRELSEYQKLSHLAVATEDNLHEHLFGLSPKAEVLIADYEHEPVGFAVFFPNFSTFSARPGIYLEDLYVRPSMRGIGVGKSLLAHIANIAQSRGCVQIAWSVLNWNTPAIDFYKKIGSTPQSEWTVYHLEGQPLAALAEQSARL